MLEFSVFLGLKYLEKGILILAEIFRTFYSQIDLFMGKISGRNTVIRFIGIYHAQG